MGTSKFTEEQIVYALKQTEVGVPRWTSVASTAPETFPLFAQQPEFQSLVSRSSAV
jgi:hypothetical protein